MYVELSSFNFAFRMALLFAVLDLTLTYYQLFLHKKKVPNPENAEINVIGKFLMKITKLKPYGLILAAIYTIGLLFVFTYIAPELTYIYLGGALIANLLHINNIQSIKRHWNDDVYWFVIKKRNEGEI